MYTETNIFFSLSCKPPARISLFKLAVMAGCEEKSTASIRGTDPEPNTGGGEMNNNGAFLSPKAPETIWLRVHLASALTIHPFLSTEPPSKKCIMVKYRAPRE